MSDEEQWFPEFQQQLLDCIDFGMPPGHIAMLLRRAECAEHAAIMFRLARNAFEMDVISGKSAKEARRISEAVRSAVFERDGEKCVYCGTEEGPFHIDHVRPVSKGGSGNLSNLVVACEGCNLSKGAKTLQEWRGEDG